MRIATLKASLAVIAMLFAVQAATQSAFAQSYYVSSSGSDTSGTGSMSSPWATISYASGHAGPGAVVHVQAGSYSGNVSTASSGTASDYITYEGDNSSWKPVNCARIAADHGDLSQCPQLLNEWDNSGNYVKIQGFDVTSQGINGIYTQGNATVIAENNVHNILPSTCNSTGGSGINLNGTNAEVTDNYVHNIGPYPSACGYVQGIYFLQAGGYADNNISFNNAGFGIQLWHYPSHIVLENNTIFNNASGGIVLGTDYSNVTVDYITVANNIVAENGGVGIAEQGCCSTSTGMHNVYLDNLLYGNSGGSYSLQNSLTASGTVDSSPDFVNDTGTSSGSYQLQAGSPAIGAATSNGSPSTDFDGNPRPQNNRYDIGAYEYMDPATAALSVSPTSLGFSSTDVGSTSVAQSVTVTNQASGPASLAGISISGANASSFAETNNCGSSLDAGASCVINLKFDPQATGTLSADANISPSTGNALQVSLSGNGVSAPEVSLSPVSLSFSSTTVGATSAVEYSTLKNRGTATLTFSNNFAISGPFAFGGEGTCNLTVAPGASCTISVVFKPTAEGTASGAITLSDNAGTQTLALSGSGTAPVTVNLSPTSLSFPSTAVGASSAIEYSTLTNTGSTILTFSNNFAISGPFAFGGAGTCNLSVAPGAGCTISVVFKPTTSGAATGAVTLIDNVGTQTLALSGTAP